jgi:MFS family permease
MSKPVLGLVLGGILGIFDGLTAWFTPAVRDQLAGIVVGSTIKGLIAGILIGWFAKKFNSLPLGIVFGLAVGLLLAFAVAAKRNRATLLLRDNAPRSDPRTDRWLRYTEVRPAQRANGKRQQIEQPKLLK